MTGPPSVSPSSPLSPWSPPPLTKVTDMSFQRSSLGRVPGYGEFILESAGQDQALRVVDHLPYPEQLYLEVCGLIFEDKEDSPD